MLTFEAAIYDLIQQGLISREDGMNFLRRRTAGKKYSSGDAQGIRLANNPAQ